MNTESAPQFANEVAVGGILVAGAFLNSKGLLTIGTFAALISLFRKIGKQMIIVTKTWIKLARGTIALRKVCAILNAPTGVEQQLKVSHETTEQMIKCVWSSLGMHGQV